MFERWTRCDWTRKREGGGRFVSAVPTWRRGRARGNEGRECQMKRGTPVAPSHNSPITRVEAVEVEVLRIPRRNLAPDHTCGREYRESRGKLGSTYKRSPGSWPRTTSKDVERRTGRLSNTERCLVPNMSSSSRSLACWSCEPEYRRTM
jgi:hypothetical protein